MIVDETNPDRLVRNPDEQKAITEAKRIWNETHSLRATCRELDRLGLPPRDGGEWSHTSLKGILTREGVL